MAVYGYENMYFIGINVYKYIACMDIVMDVYIKKGIYTSISV